MLIDRRRLQLEQTEAQGLVKLLYVLFSDYEADKISNDCSLLQNYMLVLSFHRTSVTTVIGNIFVYLTFPTRIWDSWEGWGWGECLREITGKCPCENIGYTFCRVLCGILQNIFDLIIYK